MFERGQKVSRILVRYNDVRAIPKIYEMLQPIFNKKLKKLKQDEKTFCYIMFLNETIKVGGFKAYYTSDMATYAFETLTGLSELGLDDLRDVFFESMQPFHGMVPKELVQRQLVISNNETCSSLWETLESKFKQHSDNLYDVLLEFIRDNILEFR